jgi:hypothetical protein
MPLDFQRLLACAERDSSVAAAALLLLPTRAVDLSTKSVTSVRLVWRRSTPLLMTFALPATTVLLAAMLLSSVLRAPTRRPLVWSMSPTALLAHADITARRMELFGLPSSACLATTVPLVQAP